MKKIVVILLMALVLFGCSGPKEVTKACSVSQQGMELTIGLSAPSQDEDIDSLTMAVNATYEAMGIPADQVANMSDDMKKAMTDLLEAAFAQYVGNGDMEGIELTRSDFTDTGMELEMKMDIKALAEQSGQSLDSQDLKIDTVAKGLEDIGFTCK